MEQEVMQSEEASITQQSFTRVHFLLPTLCAVVLSLNISVP